jgi:glycerol-3-phosphate dehydrogenase
VLAEAALAARREQAHTVGDVLLRRTRLGLLAARELRNDRAPVLAVAKVLGAELGWDAERGEREVERYEQEARDEGLVVGN